MLITLAIYAIKHVLKKSEICHELGKYKGPACNICNLNHKQQDFISIIFHNCKGYDFNQ